MASAAELRRQLHERLGTQDDPEVDRIIMSLALPGGDPTAGEDTNALIHRLYDRLGGQPSHGHATCPVCIYTGEEADRPRLHAHAHVACKDGETTGQWSLDCTGDAGSTFTVTGSTYEEALRAALDDPTLPASSNASP